MIEQLVEDIARSLGSWAYLLIALIAFMETAFFVGFLVPGEFTIIFGGVLAGQGTIEIYLLIGIVWFAAFAGDTTSFYLGKRLGRGFLIKHGRRFRVTEERIRNVEAYFDRHGGKTILIGRFIGFVRALAPFSAGASKMELRRFIPYDILGTGIWSTVLLLLGYFFWQSFEKVVAIAGRGTLIFGVLVLIVVLGVALKRRLKDPQRRAELRAKLVRIANRPVPRMLGRVLRPVTRPLWYYLVRPLTRVAWPQIRFMFARFKPGGLGLELTTLLAIAAVGLYVVLLYVSLVRGDPGPTPGDLLAADIAGGLRAGWHTQLIEIVTQLGRVAVVGLAVFLASIYLLRKRQIIDAAVLVAGFTLTWSSVLVIKATVGRPRPEGGLVDTVGSSFPSGHAALTVSYIAIAILITRAGLRRWSGTAVITTGIVVAVAVGLTRLYLGAHYLSDITVGWAVGAVAFSLCGVAGLVLGFIESRRERPGRAS